jgi:hypothetical protein
MNPASPNGLRRASRRGFLKILGLVAAAPAAAATSPARSAASSCVGFVSRSDLLAEQTWWPAGELLTVSPPCVHHSIAGNVASLRQVRISDYHFSVTDRFSPLVTADLPAEASAKAERGLPHILSAARAE